MKCKYLNNTYCKSRNRPCYKLNQPNEDILMCQYLYSSSGFLAPDGTFFYCTHYNHMKEAINIVKSQFNISINDGYKAEIFLLEHNYVGIYSQDVSFKSNYLSEQQIKFLEYILSFIYNEHKINAINNLLNNKK